MEDTGLKALTHGLDALRVLIEARGPLSSTEIGERIGLHQSTASRILKTLMNAGYVRKPDYHSFTIDYGVLTLSSAARAHFPLVETPRAAVQQLAEDADGLLVSLATIWKGQMIYFLRAQKGQDTISLSSGGFPLHLSSPALRLLLDESDDVALAALEDSRRRYGWERPTNAVPATPKALLAKARELLEHDCLLLENWQGEARLSAAIAVQIPGEPPAALALSGTSGALSSDRIRLLLQDGRRKVEAAFALKNSNSQPGDHHDLSADRSSRRRTFERVAEGTLRTPGVSRDSRRALKGAGRAVDQRH
ncbi:MAG TPA: helix-turn-helix domain-containing protein [Planctomycetota bacterium]|nr:helix-turn-helix domain-containing protein [Planctomycetota bacterium]